MERLGRCRRELRKPLLDIFDSLSKPDSGLLSLVMKEKDLIGCLRNERLGRTSVGRVLEESKGQN